MVLSFVPRYLRTNSGSCMTFGFVGLFSSIGSFGLFVMLHLFSFAFFLFRFVSPIGSFGLLLFLFLFMFCFVCFVFIVGFVSFRLFVFV